MHPTDPAHEIPPCDLSRRFVRVLKRRNNGFVEFEFSIGWPELCVELLLTEPDFKAFCETQQARQLPNQARA